MFVVSVLFAASVCVTHCHVSGQTLNAGQNSVQQDVYGAEFPYRHRLHPLFHCHDTSPSANVPTSVEFVKAADVKVIAALGDSLTTACGANGSTFVSIAYEYRHMSWSIGGHKDVITLANIFKLFNPKLLGLSPEMTFYGNPTSVSETGFNFAVTGHNTLNILNQIRNMIDTFKSHPGLNFQKDWKVVTLLIGMNDICDYCKNKKLFSPDSFAHHMTEALDLMMNEIPRTIVNLVQIPPMKPLRKIHKPILGCYLRKVFCSCLIKPEENSPELQELVEINYEFQRRLEKLLQSDRFIKKDFAVVLQPFMENTEPPRLPDGTVDFSFFTADCLHFSVKGHEELAKGLWNNMFQPDGGKDRIRTFLEPMKPICPPPEHPYIYTRPREASLTATLKRFAFTLMTLFSSLVPFHSP
ncbi:phospholipase B1, membrane-associated-like [Solea solea]|uniref:phospholipase B1, membrane-associated-like n=1 Tax=Solea solea TaxID=90069 RepID=UPI00272D989F|nr:phospholipase B1, membrane-associated-like [Solea solea]